MMIILVERYILYSAIKIDSKVHKIYNRHVDYNFGTVTETGNAMTELYK